MGLSQIDPDRVKAHKSFLFIEGSPEVENKEHLFEYEKIIGQIVGFSKDKDQNGDRVS